MYVDKHSASNSYWPAHAPRLASPHPTPPRHSRPPLPPQLASSSGDGDHGHDKPSRKQDQKSDNNGNGD